jgi:hypothetical protein
VIKALRYYSGGPGIDSRGVTGFFSDIFPSDRTMALGSTQPLVKMSTRNIPGGKCGRCVRLTTSPPPRAECHKSGSLKLLEPSGPHRARYGTPLPFTDTCVILSVILHLKIGYLDDV